MYTVHLRRNAIDSERDLVFVREGFSWLAFLYPLSIVWAMWHRMWLVAAVLLIAPGVLETLMIVAGVAPGIVAGVMLAAALVLGFFANDLRRWWLTRKGFDTIGVVGADDASAAEQRFHDLNPSLAEALSP